MEVAGAAIRCYEVIARPQRALRADSVLAVRLVIDDSDRRALVGRVLGRDGIRLADDASIVVMWSRRPASEHPTAIRDARVEAGDRGLVVVLPGTDDGGLVRRSFKAGADGLLFERDVARALCLTVGAVSQGFVSVPRSFRGHMLRRPLSHREKQVLRMVVGGLTNRQIAGRLYLAESTVKTHVSSAFEKIGARSRAEAAAVVLDPDEGLAPMILEADELDAAQPA